jgi:hypothetical protein
MKAMWLTILWMFGLWAVLAFGAEAGHKLALPAIHLVRVNDPVGLQGFDLKCKPAEAPSAEPECLVTEVKASKTVETTSVPVDKARKMAAAFLGQMPQEKIYDATRKRQTDPPVADVLLVWNVQLGAKGSDGILKRNPTEAERDPALQRAVLLLEADLARGEE